MKQKTLVRILRLENSNDKIYIKIKTGNGQPSATTVYKNGSKIKDLAEPYNDFELGASTELTGTDFLFTTSVHDIAETPNRILVIHEVKTGSLSLLKTDFDIPVDEGEVAICSTQVYFLKK